MTTREQHSGAPWDRAAMDPAAVTAALAHPAGWEVRHLSTTGSTNDDLAAGRFPAVHPTSATVLVTEEQVTGRGRSGRQWACPPGAGLMFSIRLILPRIPVVARGWIGAILGMAIVEAIGELGVTAGLKWPNDVLLGGAKCGGILAEMAGDDVIVGAGLNISLSRSELPRPDATSLRLAGAASVDRNALLASILDRFGVLLGKWQTSGGDVDGSGLRTAYLRVCATIGSQVRVELPGGRAVTGIATDVDAAGAIVVEGSDGRRERYSAGDVVHLRPAGSPPEH